MAEPISIQQLKDASEDAITLADFIYKPANVMIPRRLAADINSLQYYLDYMSSYAQRSYETYDEMVANAVNLPNGVSAFVANDLDATKNGIYTYNGTSFVKGDYQPENAAKDYVEAKLGGLEVFEGKVRAQDVVDESLSQQTINKGLESIADLSTIENPNDGLRVYVKSYHAGLGKGGGYFTYDSTKAGVNDGGIVIDGWVRSDVYNTIKPEWFGAKGVQGHDDSDALQKAIQSFSSNYAGTIRIEGDLFLYNPVVVNKTGVKLQGVGNKKSQIIVMHGGVGIHVEPLFDGAPYTNVAYCKFYIDDLCIYAGNEEAQTTGTGLFLKYIFACSFHNLMTLGFAKHILFSGSHLNTFYNLFQGNYNYAPTSSRAVEIHNRGVGMLADATSGAGETTSNNNHIIGGWLNNISLDFRNMPGTVVEKIDIEPASDTIYTGNGCVFKECRFERFNYYALAGKYPRFPWFNIGSYNKFYDNEYNDTGANNALGVNPTFYIQGDNNSITIPSRFSHFHIGLIELSDTSKENTFIFDAQYKEREYASESTTVKLNNHNHTFEYLDAALGNKVITSGDAYSARGRFTNYALRNEAILSGADWVRQNVSATVIDIPLPFGRASEESTRFAKIEVTTLTETQRFTLNPSIATTAPESGVYTMCATVYVPSTSTKNPSIGATYGASTPIHARDKWVVVRARANLLAGDSIIPTIRMFDAPVGTVFYIGEISVCRGNAAVYIPSFGVKSELKGI